MTGNVTLSVISRKREEVVAYSGEESTGVALGAAIVFLLLALVVVLLVIRHRETLITVILGSRHSGSLQSSVDDVTIGGRGPKQMVVNVHQLNHRQRSGVETVETVIANPMTNSMVTLGRNHQNANYNHTNHHRTNSRGGGGSVNDNSLERRLIIANNHARLGMEVGDEFGDSCHRPSSNLPPGHEYVYTQTMKSKQNYGSIVLI